MTFAFNNAKDEQERTCPIFLFPIVIEKYAGLEKIISMMGSFSENLELDHDKLS